MWQFAIQQPGYFLACVVIFCGSGTFLAYALIRRTT
jgi:hypothetical protein